MAVSLDFTYLQSNDAKTILITDDTGGYDASTNTGGWGTPNADPSDVILESLDTVDKYHLTLDITYTDSSGVETTYDTIDLYDKFTSEFTKDYGMEFELDMSYLEESGVAAGDSDDVFPDGIYDITYTILDADTDNIVSQKTYYLLADGVIRILVYDNVISNNSTVYKQKQFNADERDWQDLLEALFIYSYFNGLNIQDDSSSRSEKLEMLNFLQQKLN